MDNIEKLGGIDNSIFHYISKASSVLLSYFNRLLIENDFSITAEDWLLLFHVIKHPGKNQKWYAENILKDKTTTMRIVDALEKKELIKREPAKTDRRQNRLYITESGSDLMQKTIPLINDGFQSLFKDTKIEHINITVAVLKEITNKLSPN